MKSVTLLLIFIVLSYCHAGFITNTGQDWTDFTVSGSEPQHAFESDLDIERWSYREVKFRETFTEIPRVAIFLHGFQIGETNPGVKLEIVRTWREYFIYKIIAPEGANISAIGVSWIATIDESIQFSTLHVDESDSEFNPLAEGHDLRAADFVSTIPHEINLHEAQAVVGITSLVTKKDIQALNIEATVDSVGPSSANIHIEIWGDIQLHELELTVVHFNSYGESKNSDLTIQTSYKGPLYAGEGDRQEEVEVEEVFDYPIQLLFVASTFDFAPGHPYQIKYELHEGNADEGEEESSDTSNGDSLIFFTRGDTKIIRAVDNIFVTGQEYQEHQEHQEEQEHSEEQGE
jgi:hypothetical protein